jgi:hypothetical protein
MTTRRGLRVWVGRALRGMTALALTLAAFVIAATSGAAMGRPPLLDDRPHPAVTAPPRAGVTVPACAEASETAPDGGRLQHDQACTSPAPASAVSVVHPEPAATVARPAPPAGRVVPPGTVATAASAALRPLPVPPPIRLMPTLTPVPQSDTSELAPTSVLVLGFGSVALASTVMALRLLRGGR